MRSALRLLLWVSGWWWWWWWCGKKKPAPGEPMRAVGRGEDAPGLMIGEMILRQRVVKDQLEIIYQSSEAVRLAKYTLKNFQKLSDIEVARIDSK